MAIVTFRSKAAGEILMFRETAETIFKLFNKPLGLRGVLTPEELPSAIKAIKDEIEREKELIKELKEKENRRFRESKDLDEDKTQEKEKPVFFAQRAFPLLEMMEFALKANEPITWGI